MSPLGLTLFGLGFLGLAATVIYALIDRERTGDLFRRKAIFLPLILVSGAFGLAGMAVVYLSKQS